MRAPSPDDEPDSVSTHLSQTWDAAYAGTPPWEIGRPQEVFVTAAERGLLRGRLLDIGCGTGEATRLAAAAGADALGIDISRAAIAIARAKASQQGSSAAFAAANILALGWTGELFDTVIDSGTFHLFSGPDRAAYVVAVGGLLRSGGVLHLLCARAAAGPIWGPPGLSRDDLSAAFSDGWEIDDVRPARYEVASPAPVSSVDAWYATVTRS